MFVNEPKKNKSQLGYSMVEMIGALAVLALLLMASVRGLSYSFDRQAANELGQEIMQRAADVKMQLDRPKATFYGDKWDTKSRIGAVIDFEQNDAEVGIQIHRVEARVCEMVMADLSHLQGVSRVDSNCASDVNSTMIFYFEKLDGKKRVKDDTCFCDAPKVCDENGDCVCPPDSPIGYEADTCTCPDYLMPIKGKCLCEDETEPVDGKCGNCSTDEDCDGGLTCENHTCTCIAKECSESDFTNTLCACCPVETPKWNEVEGVCKTCADIDINLPVYNKETKTCEACPDNKVWDSVSGQCVECVVDTDCAESGFVCTNNVCECAEGTSTPCSSNLIQTTNTSKYNQICYLCRCPTDSTMSGNTCVCNNECQTYDVTTKMCVNKANGTVCTNGVCSGGMCINDTCPSGTQKSCASDLVATKTAQTASGTWCYTCGCPSGAILSGTTCTCTSECQTYDTSAKMCANKTDGTTCSDGLCKNGSCLNDTCPLGEYTSCSANLVATASSKTAYGTQCYTCGCPSGSTLSGNTCVCNNECQTYNTSTKTCTNKANGTTCTNGLCSNGSCKNDTCPSGTVKTCSANLVATASSKTAYGTQCYTCGCPSGSTLSSDGTTCVCNDECQTYNASTKTCVSKTDGTTCSTGLCKTGVCTNDTCPTGTAKTCSANLVATASSKTAYGTQCYTCGCPSGATLSGTTCVCSNECQTYNTSTKTCVNKTDGTTCSTGLCKTGVCKNDTCTTGVKTCATNYTKTQVSTTAYGTACYQCCASPKVWNGSACACPSSTPTYANASTCACNSGETNKNGVCTPSLYPTCATYCQNRNSTSSGTFATCRNTTTTSKLNLVLYLQHTVSSTGAKTYTLVSQNTYNGQTATYTYKLGTGSTYFETECEYGYATYNGSYYSLEWTNASSSSLCKGLLNGAATCYTKNSKEISNEQKTTCNTFCNTYASRYGW